MATIQLNVAKKRQEHVSNSDTSCNTNASEYLFPMMLHSIFVTPIPIKIIDEGLAGGILTGDHNSILESISRTGNIDHDWIFLKKLFASKIVEVGRLSY